MNEKICTTYYYGTSDLLHNKFLSLEHGVLLQHLKVVFLICGVLVDHEDVGVQFGDDEAQVELSDDLHLFEHVFTDKDTNGSCGTSLRRHTDIFND